jgi:hypothetical protein
MRQIQAAVLLLFGGALLTQSACEPTYTYVGYQMWDHVPLDADRTWTYANDGDAGFELAVHKAESPAIQADQDIFIFEHTNAETGDLLMEVQWSSDSLYGVLIHGYTTYVSAPAGPGTTDSGTPDTGETGDPPTVGETVVYDPPVQFAGERMAPGDSEETVTGGYTFTSSFPYTEACPNHWTQDWNECLKIELDDGDGDDTTGSLIAGEYWLVTRYGIAWFEPTGAPDKWVLKKHACTKEGVEC